MGQAQEKGHSMSDPKDEKPAPGITAAASQAARAESAPAPVRRYRALLFRLTLILAAVAFAGLTLLVETTPALGVDLQLTIAIQSVRFAPFALLMRLVSWPGFTPQAMIITGLTVVSIYGLGLHWEAVMTLIGVGFSTAINVLIKDLIQRPRPVPGMVRVFAELTSYSFPSGHVMFYLGLFGFIGFLAFSQLKPSAKRGLLLVFSGGMVGLIGVSRVYLGQHWASDVLGSYLLGSLILVAAIQCYLWGKTRFFVHQPVAADQAPQRHR